MATATVAAGVLAFLGAVIGALFSPYVARHLANRPKRLVSQVEPQKMSFWIGGHTDVSYVVAQDRATVSDDLSVIHAAAVANWGAALVSYADMVEWLASGACGSDGKPTIDRVSTANPDGAATQPVGQVFTAHPKR